jgi:hypothetical protein
MMMTTDHLRADGIDRIDRDGVADHRGVADRDGVAGGGGGGGLRVNVNAHSSEAGCGTERDKLHGRVDHASAGRGDGTALHRDTAVNGRAMDRSPAERERVLAFSSHSAHRTNRRAPQEAQ